MPTIITAPLLGSINNGLQLAFNTQFWEAPSVFKKFTFQSKSTGDNEVYPRLDMLPGVREWIGSRVAHSLTQESFSIKNRKFEETIAVARTDIEDDKYGMYAPVASQMGMDAGQVPDLLVAQLIKAGTTGLAYDGQPFFSTTHQNFVATGNGVTTAYSNYVAGSNPGWYLVDTSKVLRPFIFQDRIPFELTARFNPEDPSVFDNDEYLWGVRGRCAAGFGLWQLAYFSQAALNVTNLIAARTAMSTLRRPDGTPMGVTPNMLIVPSTLYPLAKSYYENGLIGSDPSTPTTLVQNTIIGMFEPVEYKWLN